ncbi:hypothetical protein DFR29_103336 [Tahibacter aquaticus]|uniref:Patatin-like phospholipase n=1 Tax=Tahibacter aquaticus TaxID=520092 RepID=A0A4R6Z536_9GAMM|nr:hypothetical protein [Tahibacter aquaticus]TDR46800.1 hypothetical protein DFR29_103336 [Tahibacter aquaticus]
MKNCDDGSLVLSGVSRWAFAAIVAMVCGACANKATRYDLAALDVFDERQESGACDPGRQGERNPELCSAAYFSDANLDSWFHVERWRDAQRPAQAPIGLALSGGGTKSANFAMGVLSGSYDRLLRPGHIGLISSVSGGGYSAFWYISRLLDAYGNLPGAAGSSLRDAKGGERAVSDFHQIFDDCLPKHYFALSEYATDKERCPLNMAHYENGTHDRFRYQTHLRGFQDLLSNNYNVELPGNDSNALTADVAKLGGLTTLSLIPHHVANTLFDWRRESPSRETYMRGIERTFGLMPPDCNGREVQTYLDAASCRDFRLLPNRLLGRGHTFAAIRLLREFQWQVQQRAGRDIDEEQAKNQALPKALNKPQPLPPVPFWIVNTTAATRSNPTELLSSGQYDVRDAVFEFTPTGFGSRRFGYWEGSHPSMDTLEATVTSGAFFDSQQRSISQPWRAGVGLGMRLSSLEWGKDIENPAQIDSVRGWHTLLPIPLYYLDPQATGATKPGKIHLSDGGQSENTGIYSLVRRGITQIVYADGSQDEFGQFGALCHLKLQLEKSHLRLTMTSLENFDNHCAGKNGDLFQRETWGYDLWASNGRVLSGCISSDLNLESCSRPNAHGYFATLFVLKPMLPWHKLAAHVAKCKVIKNVGLDRASCAEAFLSARVEVAWMDPELFGFLARKRCDFQLFPQNKTWRVTLNSTSSLFGSYRELGKVSADALSVDVQGRVSSTDVATLRWTKLEADPGLTGKGLSCGD